MKKSLFSVCLASLLFILLNSNVVAQMNHQNGLLVKNDVLLQSNPVPNYDSIYNWSWNGSQWQYGYRIRDYVYDTRNNLLEYTLQFPENNGWINGSKRTVTYYNSGSKILSDLLQQWTNNFWTNSSLIEYQYYDNDSLKSFISSMWSGTKWDSLVMFSYEYNLDSNYKKETISYFDQYNYYLQYYWYNTDKLLTMIESWTWDGNTLEKDSQTDYEYNEDGKLISSLAQLYIGSQLIPDRLNTYSYEGNNLTEQIYKTWNGTELQNNLRITYNYDNVDNLTFAERFDWSGTNWVKDGEGFFTYDQNRYMVSEVSKYYFGNVLANADSIRYYFNSPLGADEPIVNFESISIYPNPSNGHFTLTSDKPIKEIEVFNLNGELMYYKALPGTQMHDIDLTSLKSGAYLIRTGKASVGKIIKVPEH